VTVTALSVLCLLAGEAAAKVYLHETFDDDSWEQRWVLAKWKEGEGLAGKFELSHGKFFNDEKADMGLKTTQDAKFYTASTSFDGLSNKDKTLVLQFQVKNEQNIECGGSYLKFGPKIDDPKEFKGETQYSVMFGPDMCGSATRKTHLIFNYKGKNLDRKKDIEVKNDNLSHLYTLVLRPNNTYEVQIDQKTVADGSLYDDWNFLPPKQIKDPSQSKPKDWVDAKEIDDPEDKKPESWVEEKQIPDPNASKPDDWDEEEDGEWTPPMIDNPDYKGEWKAKRIPNPDYKGEWVHPMIDNPDYFDDPAVYAYSDISMVGIDLWQVKAGTIFDNIVVCDSEEEAKAVADKYFVPLRDAEKKLKEEEDKKKAEEEEARRKEEEAKEKEEDDEEEDEEDEDEEAPEEDEGGAEHDEL